MKTLRFVLFVAMIAGAASRATAAESIISLPPLMVEEKGTALRWRYLMIPGSEFLSVCDDAVSEKFVRRQLRLEELLRVILPDRFRVTLSVPEAQILFNEETGRARSRELIAEMVRKEGATVRPDGTIIIPPRLAGLAGRAQQRIRFLPNIRLSDSDSSRVFAIVRDPEGAPMEFTFTKDRIAFLLLRRAPALPDWFVEGMLELYPTLKFGDDAIEFGRFSWISEEETQALARDAECPRLLLPMAELFSKWKPAANDDAPELDRVWRAQCALFLRWALSDRTGVRREALWRWLERLEAEPAGEAGFREHFGLGFSDARDALSDSLPAAVSSVVSIAAPKPGPLPRTKFRDATDLEIARIRGDWERLQIQFVRKRYPDLVDAYIEQARRTVRRVYDRGERHPELMAVMGLTECDAANRPLARGFLEAAVREKAVRPRAYLELAWMRYQELQGGEADRKFEESEVKSILEPLLAVRGMQPPLAELYALIAGAWMQSAAPPQPADLAVLDEGARLFPGSAPLMIRVIHLYVNQGDLARANMLAETAERHARDATHRDRFARLRTELGAGKR